MTSTVDAATQMPNDTITSAEAARLLGVDQSTLNRWAQSGAVSCVFRLPGKTGARLYSRQYIKDRVAAAPPV